MAQVSHSPIFEFLTQKENLPAVLEVTRYAEEIREYVAGRFWNRLEEAIKNNPNGKFSFSWDRKLSDESEGDFSLIARPPGLAEKGQGLRYCIAAGPDYFGLGLNWNWNEKANGIEKLCQLEPLKALQAELKKQRRGDIESEPNRWWLWWEYWSRNPYTEPADVRRIAGDPWSWFGRDRDDSFFNDSARNFWDFVLPIHPLVLEANKALSRSRP